MHTRNKLLFVVVIILLCISAFFFMKANNIDVGVIDNLFSVNSEPKLSIKDLNIDKKVEKSFFSSSCIVDINGLIKNEGNENAKSPYVICKYYVGGKLIDTARNNFLYSGIYSNAEESFSFHKSFDSGVCSKLRIECDAYCQNC